MQNLTKLARRAVGMCVLGAAVVISGCQTMDKATEMAKKAMPGGDETDLMALSEKMIGNTAASLRARGVKMKTASSVRRWEMWKPVSEVQKFQPKTASICRSLMTAGR